MADGLNAAKKYIVTHRPESLAWGPFEALGPDIVEGVRHIKSQDGPHLIVSGSCSLTSTQVEHGLAVRHYPQCLQGRRAFEDRIVRRDTVS
jgi:hypothetical protein